METPIAMEVEVISTWVSLASLPQKDFIFILKAFQQPPGRALILSGEFLGSYGARMGNREEGGRPGRPRVGGTRFAVWEAAPWSKKYLHRTLLSSKCYSKSCGLDRIPTLQLLTFKACGFLKRKNGHNVLLCALNCIPFSIFWKQKKRLELFFNNIILINDF